MKAAGRSFPILQTLAILSLLNTGAIFGFFFAWACSVMWGLDATDPVVAITAMQAINASVRNPLFALAFFGTPVVLALTAMFSWASGEHLAARLFGSGALLYILGAMIPTFAVNVPLNETLALAEVPIEAVRTQELWRAYSSPWYLSNAARATASGLSLLLIGLGIFWMGRKPGC